MNGQVLLANLFFLFWLGLIPFVVRWIGEDGLTRDTVIAFGVIMLLCTLSFALLFWVLFMANRDDAPLRKLTRAGHRGRITIIAYSVAIALAFIWPLVSVAIYAVVAVMWLLPEKKFEQLLD